jgi:hypothetical protein
MRETKNKDMTVCLLSTAEDSSTNAPLPPPYLIFFKKNNEQGHDSLAINIRG